MIKLPSPGFLIQAFGKVMVRFPGVMVCAFVAVASLFVLVEDSHDNDVYVKLWMSSMLGLPLLTAVTAFAESRGWDEKRNWLAQGVTLLLLGGYYFTLDLDAPGKEYKTVFSYMATMLVVHLAASFAPYLNKRSVRDFWEYNKQLFASFIVGAAFSLILFAGLSLAVLAVDQLFDVNVGDRTYARLFIFLAGIFNTVFFLFHFPADYQFDTSEANYNFMFRNLCKFILIPVVALYFVILYAYSLKIIVTWTLPRGWVGSLVTGFSVAGIFTYLLNFYLPDQDDAWHVRAYKRWFWWIILPMTVLLFAAIGRRIGDYGVTEERYLVALMGVWLALACIYFLISKKDNIKFIPISLAVFALSWGYGPFSARAVSDRSQMSRLTKVLERNGRMENGKMKPGTAPVTDQEAGDVEGAIDYFISRENMNKVEELLPVPLDSLPTKEDYYGDTRRIMDWLGIKSSADNVTTNSYYLQSRVTEGNIDLDIRGFDKLYQVRMNNEAPDDFEDGIYFSLSKSGTSLQWYSSKSQTVTLVDSIDLKPAIKDWMDVLSKTPGHVFSRDESIKNYYRPKGNLRLIMQYGTAYKAKESVTLDQLSGYILLKEKK